VVWIQVAGGLADEVVVPAPAAVPMSSAMVIWDVIDVSRFQIGSYNLVGGAQRQVFCTVSSPRVSDRCGTTASGAGEGEDPSKRRVQASCAAGQVVAEKGFSITTRRQAAAVR